MSDIKKNELTDAEIESIATAAEEMRQSKTEVEVNPDAPLEVGVGTTDHTGKFIGISGGGEAKSIANAVKEHFESPIDESIAEIDRIAEDFENHVDILTMNSGNDVTVSDATSIETTVNTAKDTFDLSDEDAFKMIEVLTKMKEDPKYPVFANLPEKIQLTISQLAYENKVDPSYLNTIARGMMNEFINQAGIDQSLIDLEIALNDALKIPSVMDMYTEHTREVMDNIIPETIEKIKDEFPEKAERLEAIRTAFHEGFDFSRAKKAFEENARLRKTIRRIEYSRSVEMFNYMNDKSNFKMNDATQMLDVLVAMFITDLKKTYELHRQTGDAMPELETRMYGLEVTEDDIKKFLIMITKSCENMNPHDPVDAAYMYYMVRNIIALAHTSDAKTDFAAELINNICDAITFIRDKESEFCESNSDKRKSNKKHASKKGR